MAFCENCGVEIDENKKLCNGCEALISEAPPTIEISDIVLSSDGSDKYEAEDIRKNRKFAILAYLGILVFIPVAAAPDSEFARFHANQGLVLFIVSVIGSFIPVLNGLFSLIVLLFTILGILNASKGRAKRLPVIGKIKLIK